MKKYFMMLLLLLSGPVVWSCDICGCFMGITPYDNQGSAGFIYRMRSFNGYYGRSQTHRPFPSGSLRTAHGGHNPGLSSGDSVWSGKDYEEFRVIEFRARYFLHQRIELNVIMPFIFNKSETNGHLEQVSGSGDLNLFAAVHLLLPKPENTWQHRLMAGSGIKLPTGSNSKTGKDGIRHDLMMQPGTGSTDYFIYAQYITGFRKLGGSLNVMYKINGENKHHESVCNSVTSFASLFCRFRAASDFYIMPTVQGYYEKSNGVSVNGEILAGTSMHVAMAGPCLELYYRNVSFRSSFEWPVFEHQETNRPGSAGRLVIGLQYHFNQRQFIFHKKS